MVKQATRYNNIAISLSNMPSIFMLQHTCKILLMIWLMQAFPCYAEKSIPPPFSASFKMFRKNVEVAQADFLLKSLANGQFQYRAEIKLSSFFNIFYTFHVLEESHWRIHNAHLQPLYYRYTRTKKNDKTQVQANFNWKNQQISYIKNGTLTLLPLPLGMTDKLLYQINIMHDLKQGKEIMSYDFPDKGKIRTYQFKKIAESVITTPVGTFDTVKLIRQKKGQEKIILWCAEKLSYLPIKIEKTDKEGVVTTAVLNTFQWTEKL